MSTPVVLVTGALTGIGRATAEAFAKRGAKVVVSGRHPDAGEALAKELDSLGAESGVFVQADIRHEDDVRALVDQVVERHERLDIAVNNAGTDSMGPIVEQTPESYAAIFDTNVLGTLLSMKHEMRVMVPQGSGSIVNLSSIYGDKGFPGASLYVASKHAIIGLTKSGALEGASVGVRVNAVAPGPVQTPMFDRTVEHVGMPKEAIVGTIPQGRAGDVAEIADAIVFITSEQAGFLTGQTIFIDGGITAA
ncbi:MAG TPA: glucose 1-dehydrogenase [Acidimicrobiales bacterium]|jgi:NAD(P)-dependent dehydrogenase (short-subunit alcohol dehydrogenase family)|nr:glucose 1-dehydrogenase [Acidimicrobiales bacterium]